MFAEDLEIDALQNFNLGVLTIVIETRYTLKNI